MITYRLTTFIPDRLSQDQLTSINPLYVRSRVTTLILMAQAISSEFERMNPGPTQWIDGQCNA